MFPGGDPRPFHKLTKEEQATIEKKRLAGNYINQSLIENYICLQILSPKKNPECHMCRTQLISVYRDVHRLICMYKIYNKKTKIKLQFSSSYKETIYFISTKEELQDYYTPAPRRGRGVYCFTSVRPSKIFFVAIFSVTVDGRNLIFGHKHHIGIPYCG